MEKSNKSTVIAVVAVLAVIALGVGVFAVSNNSSDDTSSSSTTTQPASQSAEMEPAKTTEKANVVGLAQSTESLSTLVAAVKAADLVSTLSGDGPFTVFAPTNDAFSKLPAGTLESLLLPENKATLSGILTYHVVAGQVMSSDLSNGQVITTVNGANLTVEIADGKVMLVDVKGNKSTVTTADIEAANGVVHVIDTVVLPQ